MDRRRNSDREVSGEPLDQAIGGQKDVARHNISQPENYTDGIRSSKPQNAEARIDKYGDAGNKTAMQAMRWTLAPSRWLLRLVALAHLGSAILIVSLLLQPGQGLWWTGAALPLIGLGYWRSRTRLHHRLVVARDAFGGWWWLMGDGRRVEIRMLPESYLSVWLVILHWQAVDDRRRHVSVLLADSLPPEDFRRLRAALHQHAAAESR